MTGRRVSSEVSQHRIFKERDWGDREKPRKKLKCLGIYKLIIIIKKAFNAICIAKFMNK